MTTRGDVARWWPAASVLVGALVWYPAGWSVSSLGLPAVQLLHGDQVFFGSCAAALGASLVVTRWLPRAIVLVVASGLLWLAVTPLPDPVPHETAIVAGLLAAGQVLGFVAGTLLRRGPARLAFGLALLAASTTTERWLPVLLVAMLGCAGLHARRDVGRTVAAAVTAVGSLALWLALTLVHFAIGYGWGDVRRGSGYPTQPQAAARRVLEPARDFLHSAGDTLLGILLHQHVAALLAAVIVGATIAWVRWQPTSDAVADAA
ncbi:hypothetical protein [Angustibacter sp. Root456]|uniref:hypothetical protein n=1 Tax=Angustibacter sp. Root456 TaxID=1736539 RepID=UPI0012FC1DCE|nr:hypothetical protein [Angustibacter sp. Root456]